MLAVHKLDNPSRIKGIIQDSHFESWQAVVDFVNSFAIDVGGLANDLHVADPNAGAADPLQDAGISHRNSIHHHGRHHRHLKLP